MRPDPTTPATREDQAHDDAVLEGLLFNGALDVLAEMTAGASEAQFGEDRYCPEHVARARKESMTPADYLAVLIRETIQDAFTAPVSPDTARDLEAGRMGDLAREAAE